MRIANVYNVFEIINYYCPELCNNNKCVKAVFYYWSHCENKQNYDFMDFEKSSKKFFQKFKRGIVKEGCAHAHAIQDDNENINSGWLTAMYFFLIK